MLRERLNWQVHVPRWSVGIHLTVMLIFIHKDRGGKANTPTNESNSSIKSQGFCNIFY